MAQNIFAGGPNISETPREPWEIESGISDDTLKGESKPGAWLFEPFVDPDIEIKVSEPVIEANLLEISDSPQGRWTAIDRPSNIEEGAELNSQISELPETPFIERLSKDWIITPEIASGLQESIIAGQNLGEALTQAVIPADIKSLIQDRWEDINNSETAEQNVNTFLEDFWTEFPDLKDNAWNFTDARMEEAVHMVGSAYLVSAESSPVEKQQAVHMAFQTAGNKAIEGKQFKRTIHFQENMNLLKNPDVSPKERMDALVKILQIVDTDQGAKSSKRTDMTEGGEEETDTLKDMVEAAELANEYESSQVALKAAQKSWDIQQKNLAQQKLVQVVKNAEETTNTAIGTFSMALDIGGEEATTMKA